MRIIKLTAISAAVLVSTAAFAAEPVYVVEGNEVAPVAYNNTAPSYQYNNDAGVIRNTTGAVVGGTKTFFSTALNPAAVSAEIGSLGYGANIGWALNDKTELQAGWAGGDVADLFGGDFDVNDINYDVDSDFSNPYMGVQLRPAANWFTMGAGIIVPDNDIDVEANANGNSYKFDGTKYNASQVGTLKGSLEHRNKLAPYLTIGFRPNITNNFGVFGEIGAAYLGKTNASVNASNAFGSSVNFENDDGTTGVTNAGTVAKLAQNELEDKDYLEILPIVKLGATYRF